MGTGRKFVTLQYMIELGPPSQYTWKFMTEFDPGMVRRVLDSDNLFGVIAHMVHFI